MSDVERVARLLAGYIGRPFDDLHRDKAHWGETGGDLNGVYRDVNDMRQDDLLELAAAALREVRLIDAEAFRAATGHFRNKVGVNYAAEWLEKRAKEVQP